MTNPVLLRVLLAAGCAPACVHAATTHATSIAVLSPCRAPGPVAPPGPTTAPTAARTYLNWHLGPVVRDASGVPWSQGALVVHAAGDQRIELGPVVGSCRVPATPASTGYPDAVVALVCAWQDGTQRFVVLPHGPGRYVVVALGRSEHSAPVGTFDAAADARFVTQILAGGRSLGLERALDPATPAG